MAKGAGGVVCNCSSKTWNMINDLGAQIIVIIIKELFSFKVNKKSKLTFLIHVTVHIVHDSLVHVIKKKNFLHVIICFTSVTTFSLKSLEPHYLNVS